MGFSSRNIYHLRGNRSDNPTHLRTMGQQVACQARRGAACPPHDRVLEAVDQCLAGCHPHFTPEKYFPTFYPEKEVPRTAAPDHLSRLRKWLDRAQRLHLCRLARGQGDSDADKKAVSQMNKARHTMWWMLQLERPIVDVKEYPVEAKQNPAGETHESSLGAQESFSGYTPDSPTERHESLAGESPEFSTDYYYVSERVYEWVLNQEDPANMEVQDPNVLAPGAEEEERQAAAYILTQLSWEAKYYLPEGVRRTVR